MNLLCNNCNIGEFVTVAIHRSVMERNVKCPDQSQVLCRWPLEC